MLTAFDLCLGACGVLLTLAGTAIDFVVDRLTGLVLLQRSWSLLRSEIAAVPIDLFLISGKKFRGHRNIMLVGSCHFYRMNQTTFFIYSDMGFIAKVPYLDCGRGKRPVPTVESWRCSLMPQRFGRPFSWQPACA